LADRLRKHNAQAEARSPKERKANLHHNSSLRGNMMEDRENIFSRGGWQPPPPRINESDEKQASDRQRRFPN